MRGSRKAASGLRVSSKMKSRLGVHPLVRFVIGGSILLIALGLIAFGGQKKRRRPVQKTQTVRAKQINYSQFSHSTSKHQAECSTCHKVPTSNWKKTGDFPDIADFPDHDACVSCHRPQFFKGAKPVICSNCHQKTSPRDEARFPFRDFSPTQFRTEFPHDKHQDVIAGLERSPRMVTESASLRVWAHARSAAAADSKKYNNCEICHAANAPRAAPRGGWPDGFAPAANLFKSSPENHASCFNCHWNGPEPTRGQCAGCHKLMPPDAPSETTQRKSMKFSHAREQHVAECTTCHINITKASTLRGLQPDVPITSCTECHNKDGLRLDVSGELEALDKNREFVCSYCHTSDVGGRDAPASHYLIAGRPALKRKDMK